MKHNQIVEDLVKKYKSDKNVVGIYLFGSMAKGNYNKNSDIDIEIIFNKGNKKYDLKNIEISDIKVDLSLYDKKQFIEDFSKYPYLQYAALNNKILYDPQKILSKYLDLIKKYFIENPDMLKYWRENEIKWKLAKKQGRKGKAKNYFDIMKELKRDKQLLEIYKKYIDVPMYRVIPKRYLREILKKGINPKIDPYEKVKPKIKELAKIINNLEKNGNVIKIYWGREVYASYALAVSINDLKLAAVDFAPTQEDVEYYLRLKGGALVYNMVKITDELINHKDLLFPKEIRLVDELNKYFMEKICDNVVISVKGSSKCFESAKFQLIRRGKGGRKKYKGSTYLQSPFGSFEHFCKVINKNGLRKYLPRIKVKKYYLRVVDRIEAKDIKVMG